MFDESYISVFKTIIEHIPLGVYIMDENWVIQYVNPAIEALFARPASFFIGRRPVELKEVVDPKDFERLAPYFYTGMLFNLNPIDFCILTGQGSLRSVRGSLDLIRGEDGRVLFYQGIIVDVSGYTRVKQELAQSKDAYQLLIESMQEGFVLLQAIRKPDGYDYIFVDVNPALERTVKIPREKLIGYQVRTDFYGIEDNWINLLNFVAGTGQACMQEGYFSFLNSYFQAFAFAPNEGLVAILFIDTTERKHAEMAIHQEKEWLAVTLRSIGEGVIATDVDNRVIFLNELASELLGWTEEEAVGKPLIDLLNEAHEQSARQSTEELLDDVPEISDQSFSIVRNGQRKIIATNATYIHDDEEDIKGMVMVLRDITEKYKAEQEIKYLSCHDTLTGLYNRAYVDQVMESFEGEWNLPLSLILADLNGLKLTNDVFGHQEGDRLIIRTAEILRSCCRNDDVVARWGGDEFLIILPRTPKHIAEQICDRIRKKCKEAGCEPIEISCSLGTATRTNTGQSLTALFSYAEDLMYSNKLKESQQTNAIILNGIEATLEQRCPERREHCERLGQLASEIKEYLNLDERTGEELQLLTTYHDIGNIIVPEGILEKAGPLGEEEWRLVKKHTEAGYRVASCINDLRPIANLILSHHEHWDGKGYPRGLRGSEIPYTDRIFSIIDAYDVMTHDSFYKKAITDHEALERIQAEAGKQFAPELAQAFANMKSH